MTEQERSPEYTITMGPGTYDVIQRGMTRVREAAVKADAVDTSYEDLAHELRSALELALNFQQQLLGSLMRSNAHDHNVALHPDGPESIYFRYDSGYHGAMILHESTTPGGTRWSVHT